METQLRLYNEELKLKVVFDVQWLEKKQEGISKYMGYDQNDDEASNEKRKVTVK